MMKVHLVGKKPVVVSDKFFIHQGGQGSTFRINSSVFKIFSDLNFTLPQRKLEELSVLNRKNIVRPIELLYDSPSCTRSIGFRMDAVDSAENATIFLTSRFQQLHNITYEDIKSVVAQIADTYNYIHSNKCLVVDGSDRNFLIQLKGMVPYFIDVDSYQTKSFRAEFITPSIIDYLYNESCSKFTVESDYYSFCILCCLFFTGIHPYKGHHSSFKNNDVASRAKAKLSIFNKEVQLPSSVRDFSNIPGTYMDWFISTFEKGDRNKFPNSFTGVAAYKPATVIINVMKKFKTSLIKTNTKGTMQFYTRIGIHTCIVKTTFALYVDDVPYNYDEVFIHYAEGQKFLIFVDRKTMSLYDDKNNKLNDFSFEDFFIYDNTFYYRQANTLNTVVIQKSVTGFIVSPSRLFSNIMPNASQVFSDVVIQSMMGAFVATVPSEKNKGLFIDIMLPDMKGRRFIDAKYSKNVIMFITEKSGDLRLSAYKITSGSTVVLVYDEAIVAADINFVVKNNGVVVQIVSDGMVRVFKNSASDNNVIEIQDKGVLSSMRLFTDGDTVFMSDKDKVMTFEMVK